MRNDGDRKLLALEARHPKESNAQAIGRLFDIRARDLPGAMRSGPLNARWDEVLSPLRDLEGPAFTATCEAIRERYL
jgi:hypothetical protein